jgi:hypothetical protein
MGASLFGASGTKPSVDKKQEEQEKIDGNLTFEVYEAFIKKFQVLNKTFVKKKENCCTSLVCNFSRKRTKVKLFFLFVLFRNFFFLEDQCVIFVKSFVEANLNAKLKLSPSRENVRLEF